MPMPITITITMMLFLTIAYACWLRNQMKLKPSDRFVITSRGPMLLAIKKHRNSNMDKEAYVTFPFDVKVSPSALTRRLRIFGLNYRLVKRHGLPNTYKITAPHTKMINPDYYQAFRRLAEAFDIERHSVRS